MFIKFINLHKLSSQVYTFSSVGYIPTSNVYKLFGRLSI